MQNRDPDLSIMNEIYSIWKVEAEYEQWGGGRHPLTPHTRQHLTLSQPRTPHPHPFPSAQAPVHQQKAFVQSTVLFLFMLHLSSELSIRRSGDGWSKTEPYTHDRRIEP